MDQSVSCLFAPSKRCTKCGKEKLLTDFGMLTKGKNGRHPKCKACRNTYNRTHDKQHPEMKKARDARFLEKNPLFEKTRHAKWYKKNRHHSLETGRHYRQAHPEKGRERSKRYRTRHPERAKETRKNSYKKNRAYSNAKSKRWRENNVEQQQINNKNYRQAHPEKTKEHRQRRRAAKANAVINDLTHAQWIEIQVAQDHCCQYCQKRYKGKLTQDHILPLSKGGSHTLHNVIAACRSCNSKKHTGTVLCPVQPLLLTIAQAKC